MALHKKMFRALALIVLSKIVMLLKNRYKRRR
jgi:hypothetical protein